ncbi:MAG TPA: hypothetical protein VJ300_05995 [Thermoplasmata archaeon]|nr:hypothetical protein [Thermoplasmata archaeon]
MELKVDASDETSAAASGTLKVQGRTLELPTRIPTSSEVRAAKATKMSLAIESPVLVVGRLVTPELAKAATKEEEPWRRFAEGVARDAKSLPGAARLLQLAFRSVTYEDAEPLRSFLDLQMLHDFAAITIQYGSSPSSEDLVRAFDFAKAWAKKRKVDAALMPVVPGGASRDDAKAILEGLFKRGARAFGLDMPRSLPYQTMRAVEEFKEQHPDVFVHAFQVPPKVSFGGRLPTSQAMVLPYFGVDSVSRWIVPPPPAPVKKDKVNFFDPAGWGIFKWREYEREYGSRLRCRCAVCKGKALEDFFEPEDRLVLNQGKIHDHFAQASEFAAARKRIGDDGYAAVMAEKRFAKSFLGSLETT